ncbi:MAG: hypothetical protein ACHRXM_21280 [Isosphaerales bacterium]
MPVALTARSIRENMDHLHFGMDKDLGVLQDAELHERRIPSPALPRADHHVTLVRCFRHSGRELSAEAMVPAAMHNQHHRGP